ncbi:hypothetical protein EZS27_017204 [termite gut metagenome]|uniref:Uncharacterized protein n=1 Tax=termite gut metagenome TaxID=433724 RepID=A0A5J4RLG0_9ZZZZ
MLIKYFVCACTYIIFVVALNYDQLQVIGNWMKSRNRI